MTPGLEISLNASRAGLNFWADIATVVVIVGLVLEYGPDFIPALKSRHAWELWLTRIGGVLVVLGITGELSTHNRISQLDDQLLSIQRDKEREQAGTIAELEARAAEANLKQKELTSNNLRLRKFIAQLDKKARVEQAKLKRKSSRAAQATAEANLRTQEALKRAAEADERAADANRRAGEANERASLAQAQAEAERLARLQLEQRFTVRPMGRDVDEMAKALRAFSKQRVSIVADPETYDAWLVMEALTNAFRKAGWSLSHTVDEELICDRDARGIEIWAKPKAPQRTAKAAEAIRAFLEYKAWPATIVHSPKCIEYRSSLSKHDIDDASRIIIDIFPSDGKRSQGDP